MLLARQYNRSSAWPDCMLLLSGLVPYRLLKQIALSSSMIRVKTLRCVNFFNKNIFIPTAII